MNQEPTTLVKIMRAEYWEAISAALSLSIQHLDSTIQELQQADQKFSYGFMKNKLIVEGLTRDREIIRSALLAVLDDKTQYGT